MSLLNTLGNNINLIVTDAVKFPLDLLNSMDQKVIAELKTPLTVALVANA